jgi:hypothetical protein
MAQQVFWTTDNGANWNPMPVPSVTEASGWAFGIHPGRQGEMHLSIVAHPTDPNIVFLGGDRYSRIFRSF